MATRASRSPPSDLNMTRNRVPPAGTSVRFSPILLLLLQVHGYYALEITAAYQYCVPNILMLM
jgi:hypothetical protein